MPSDQTPEPLSEQQLAEMERRTEQATPGPWADLASVYNRAMETYKKTRHHWWSGTRHDSLVVTLIGRCVHHGKAITEEDIPLAVDYWDIQKVISLRWSQFSRRRTELGEGFFSTEDADFIVHARTDIPALLDEVRRQALCISTLDTALAQEREQVSQISPLLDMLQQRWHVAQQHIGPALDCGSYADGLWCREIRAVLSQQPQTLEGR